MKEGNIEKPRAEHETKYVFNNTFAPILINWLKLRCQPDFKFPFGVISSIYYDTKDWQFLGEKINSDYLKTKFRVRWYESLNGQEQGEKSFVEIKCKIGATREKIRFANEFTGKQLAEIDLDDPKLLAVQHKAKEQGVKIPPSLYPAFQISYKRFRFIEPKTRCRICIDYDISAPRVNLQMLPCVKPQFLSSGVVEVKGAIRELPDTLHQLTALGCKKQAFSKYSWCFAKLSGINF